MPSPVTERPLRRDAERNRERIVAAAREAFAEQGIEVPMEDVARRAGVGVGTVYRRFPTKEDLIDAVFEETLADVAAIATEALELADPWEGLRHYLEHFTELNAANRGLKDVIGSSDHGRERLEAVRDRMRPLVGRLIAAAQEQGTLRRDLSPTDLQLVYAAVGRVIELTKDAAPDAWRRFLALLLDGLRADAATPLPVPPLTSEQGLRLRAPRAGRSAS